MTRTEINELTRELATMATLNGTAVGGARNTIEAKRVNMKRKPGQVVARHRIDFYVLGQRVSRELAARYLKRSTL